VLKIDSYVRLPILAADKAIGSDTVSRELRLLGALLLFVMVCKKCETVCLLFYILRMS